MIRKVIVVFGTRPEAVKMCPLVTELKKHAELETVVCVTGQHRELLHQVLDAFGIVPDYDLGIMQTEQTLSTVTCGVLEKFGTVLEKEKPELVLVHGDTTTAYAAALAAFYRGIPVGHVEAGLRTYDLRRPFPEEFNRQSVDMVSTWLFAPTETARNNLLSEGRAPEKIIVTGNTVIDALRTTVHRDYTHPDLTWAAGSRLILVTAHRRESIGEPMRRMLRAVRRITEQYGDVKVICPVHPNPSVRRIAEEILRNDPRIRLTEPLNVVDFHNFMAASCLILTDSGGIQEEAPSLGKPVLVMRDATERPEGIAAGTAVLVGTDEERIFREVCRLLNDPEAYNAMARAVDPYGDGHACERIVNALLA